MSHGRKLAVLTEVYTTTSSSELCTQISLKIIYEHPLLNNNESFRMYSGLLFLSLGLGQARQCNFVL
jgi:hypothetical protein